MCCLFPLLAAGCSNTPSEEECQTNCLWSGGEALGCQSQWMSFIECGADAKTSCVLGYTAFQGCGPDFVDYWACVNP